MPPLQSHLRPPRRTAQYAALFVGIVFLHLLAEGGAGPAALAGLLGLLAAIVWLGCRRPPAGMEVSDRDWRFHVGERRWRVPIAELDSVRLVRWEDGHSDAALTFRNGRIDLLPPELLPLVRARADELRRRGVRVEL